MRVPEFTHDAPAKLEPSGVVTVPGHPATYVGRICPGVRKLTVWISSVRNCQVIWSPACTQNSLGRKASTWRPLSSLWTPANARHSVAWALTGTTNRATIHSHVFIRPPWRTVARPGVPSLRDEICADARGCRWTRL